MADPQSFDRFAADYDRYAGLEPPLVLDWLLTQLPGHGRRALDAGCGSGRHTLALADRFDQVLGVDLSRPLIDIARQKRPHPRIRYQVGDLLAITDPHRFDLVLSCTTLHHLPDLEAALRHLRGLVATGGTAILIDNVAPRPTPPGWVYRLGAVRHLPADLRRHGWQQTRWLLKFRTSTPWLDHLTSDRYLSRHAFQQRYGAVFPGARFHPLGHAHTLVWHNPAESPGGSATRSQGHQVRGAAPPPGPGFRHCTSCAALRGTIIQTARALFTAR
jgi:SAM-dependent methyltransferase